MTKTYIVVYNNYDSSAIVMVTNDEEKAKDHIVKNPLVSYNDAEWYDIEVWENENKIEVIELN